MEFTARTREEAASIIRATRPGWLRSRNLADGDPAAQVPAEEILDAAAARLASHGEIGWASGSDWFRVTVPVGGTWTIGVPSARVSYSASPAAFETACDQPGARRAAGDRPVPFRAGPVTRPVIASGRAFTVNLAFTIDTLDDAPMQAAQMARFLHEAGVTGDPWPHDRIPGQPTLREGGPWELSAGAVTSGDEAHAAARQAWTLSSPPLRDTPGTWQQLARACAVIRQYGGTADPRLHTSIQAGGGNLAGTDAGRRLAQTVNGYADVLTRLAQDPGGREYGFLPVRPLTLTGTDDPARQYADFRLFGGSLDPAVLQVQAAVSLALTDAAVRGGYQPPDAPEHVGSHLKAYPPGRSLSAEERQDETRSFRNLCDLLFGDNPDTAEQATALFAATCWHPGIVIPELRPERTPPAGNQEFPEDLAARHWAQKIIWTGEAARLMSAGDMPGYRHARACADGHQAHLDDAAARLPPAMRADRHLTGPRGGPGSLDRSWIPIRWQAPQPPAPAPGTSTRHLPGHLGRPAGETRPGPGRDRGPRRRPGPPDADGDSLEPGP